VEPIPETTEAIEEYGPFGSDDLLEELRAKSVQVQEIVPDCIGFSLASIEHGVTFTVAATDDELALLDAVQYLAGGPCVDAVKSEQVVTFTAQDALDEERWQHFALATAAASVASTLTLPILARDAVAGSVNLYAATRHAFTGLHEQVARVFDAWAPGAVTNADLGFTTRSTAARAPRLLAEDRDVQVAVGILAQAYDLDLGAAEAQLRDAARRAGTQVVRLAQTVIELRRLRRPD
jgi:GAF domain-containing protein